MKKAGKAHKAAKKQRAAKHRAQARHAKVARRTRKHNPQVIVEQRPLGVPSPAAVEALQFFAKHAMAPFAALEQLLADAAPDGLWHVKIAGGIEHAVDSAVRDELVRRIAPVVFPQRPHEEPSQGLDVCDPQKPVAPAEPPTDGVLPVL